MLGGTFDPPHNGHVALAETAKRRFGLDRLLVLVSPNPPHKRVDVDAETRLELAQAAFPDDRRRATTSRTRSTPSTGFGEDAIFLIGADQFAKFLTWREPDAVLELARLGVATRPGYPREKLDDVLAQLARPERVEFFEMEPIPISSSDDPRPASRRGRAARRTSCRRPWPPRSSGSGCTARRALTGKLRDAA